MKNSAKKYGVIAMALILGENLWAMEFNLEKGNSLRRHPDWNNPRDSEGERPRENIKEERISPERSPEEKYEEKVLNLNIKNALIVAIQYYDNIKRLEDSVRTHEEIVSEYNKIGLSIQLLDCHKMNLAWCKEITELLMTEIKNAANKDQLIKTMREVVFFNKRGEDIYLQYIKIEEDLFNKKSQLEAKKIHETYLCRYKTIQEKMENMGKKTGELSLLRDYEELSEGMKGIFLCRNEEQFLATKDRITENLESLEKKLGLTKDGK